MFQSYLPRPPFVVGAVDVFMRKVNVEKTYQGDPFLVTVADYDADFAGFPAYDDYGIVYNDRSQVKVQYTFYIGSCLAK